MTEQQPNATEQPVLPDDAAAQQHVAAQLDLLFNLDPLDQLIRITLVVLEAEKRDLDKVSTNMSIEDVLPLWKQHHTLMRQMLRLVSERAAVVIRSGRQLTDTTWGN